MSALKWIAFVILICTCLTESCSQLKASESTRSSSGSSAELAEDENFRQTRRYVLVVEMYSAMSKACYNCPFNATDCRLTMLRNPSTLRIDNCRRPQHRGVYRLIRLLSSVPLDGSTFFPSGLRNATIAESTAIHWYGIKQTDTPYMDGECLSSRSVRY
ncbi:hypothetical protein TSAR_003553 [Trichomalopsis sarcophagae]|uniref:Uncharacterized protein n=1 Tax=Trichomalopsis sarcophagae TaxID=543379 RepID=A0A232EZY3_9HYME|nr:hypothetical protein TSAR_003553 [Trichomalopsis sarcophagae]